jgi:hypothetical protein
MGPLEDLHVKLNDIRCKNEDQNHYFFPHQAVCELIDPGIVRKTLGVGSNRVEPYDLEEAARYIDERGGRRTFAILVLLKRPDLFPNFIKDDQLQGSDPDHKLPYGQEKLEALLCPPVSHEFWDKQWEFTAPFFSESLFARVLPDEFILPFLKKDKLLGTGALGRVFEIVIERSYLPSGSSWQGEVRCSYP